MINKELLQIIKNGNAKEFQVFLETNPQVDLNFQNQYKKTLMSKAVIKDQKEIVKILAAHPRISKDCLNQAFIYFAKKGDLAHVQQCLKYGAELNANYLGDTALMEAAAHNQVETVKFLLSQKDININLTNNMRETALLIAQIEDHPEIISLFLACDNIDLRSQGYLSGTSLTYSLFKDDQKTAEKLLEKEIKKYGSLDINYHPEALNWAVRNNNLDMVNLLISKGADVNSFGDVKHITRPDWVWRTEFTVDYPIDLEERNFQPLMWAQNLELREMEKLLLKFDAKVINIDENSTVRSL